MNLTDMRLDLAEQVLRNMSQYTSSSSEIFISCDSKCHNRNTNAIHIVVGPVINPLSGKKDTTTSYQEYLKYGLQFTSSFTISRVYVVIQVKTDSREIQRKAVCRMVHFRRSSC